LIEAAQDAPDRIYHIVSAADLREHTQNGVYRPAGLATEGFVHCSLAASVIPVANDYYADAAGPLLLLELDPARIHAAIRYEAPAPIPGGGTAHLASAPLFPHVYGPIELTAVTGAGKLERSASGYAWPRALLPLDAMQD
jgi:uncharacterized protein (DUF952 family)